MFEKLRELYKKGLLTNDMLSNAVSKGWISAEEKNLIINE